MRLEPGKLVYGVAPEILIQFAYRATRWMWDNRREDDEWLDIGTLCWALGAPWWEARPVIEAMTADGYLDKAAGETERWAPTEQFRRLALASTGRGITRAEAEALLAKVIERARWINCHPTETLHTVVRVAVFGSFLSDKAVLGDLDLAVELQRVPRALDWLPRSNERTWYTETDRRYHKTFCSLRLRKPRLISLHGFAELEGLGTPFRIVFDAGQTARE